MTAFEFLKKYGLTKFSEVDEKVKSDSIAAVSMVNDLLREHYSKPAEAAKPEPKPADKAEAAKA